MGVCNYGDFCLTAKLAFCRPKAHNCLKSKGLIIYGTWARIHSDMSPLILRVGVRRGLMGTLLARSALQPCSVVVEVNPKPCALNPKTLDPKS